MWVFRNIILVAVFCFVVTQAYRYEPPDTTQHQIPDIQPQATLDIHNKARAEVGVDAMVWNDTLATYAHNYAQQRAQDCAMQLCSGPYGENLAAAFGQMSGVDVMALWITEMKDYDYQYNTCTTAKGPVGCLHYTQIVWRDMTQVGCGSANCQNGYIFVICSYDPPGNYEGEHPY